MMSIVIAKTVIIIKEHSHSEDSYNQEEGSHSEDSLKHEEHSHDSEVSDHEEEVITKLMSIYGHHLLMK